MHVRRLLLIDEDHDFQQMLEARLGPSGFEIVLPPDPSNPLGHVKDVQPAIILIAVELPDKVGYALCNKAKKGLAREIPVILTTRSVPSSGFRSHRKLKVHADEYIDKRVMTDEEVMGKVDQLVGLAGYNGRQFLFDPDGEIEELDVDDLVEDAPVSRSLVSFDDGPEEEEAVSAVPRQIAHEGGVEFDPRELGADADDDGSFDFGEPMQVGSDLVVRFRPPPQHGNGARGRAATAAGTHPGEPPAESDLDGAPELPDMFEFEADRTAVASPFPTGQDVLSPQVDAAAALVASEQAPSRVEPDPSAPIADLDLGLDPLAGLTAEQPAGHAEGGEGPDQAQPARIAELEREVAELRDQLEDARRAAAGPSFSREREFLNLREVLNKKEKLILDLHDQIDAKDRQTLVEKERRRELERLRSDLDARNLELEQSLLGANEELSGLRGERTGLGAELRRQADALAAVKADAEQLSRLLERERAGWREERDALARKHAADLARERHEREAAEAVLHDKHSADLRALKEAFAENAAEKDKGFGAALALAEVRRQEELTAAQRGAEERLHLEMAELRRRHEDEIEGMRREQAAELQNLVRQNQEGRQALEDRQNAHIARLEEEQTQALTAAERRRASELADADKRRVAELGEAEERRRRDLAAAADERAQAEAALRDEAAATRRALEREHRAELDALEDRLAALEAALRERDTELAAARGQVRAQAEELAAAGDELDARERTIAALRAAVTERDQRVARLRHELDELERQNAGYQEQVLRAFQKIKSDEATVARAKKAMAIALTLLDDADQAAAVEAAQPDE